MWYYLLMYRQKVYIVTIALVFSNQFWMDKNNKLMKALRKHSLHEKTAASVLLKLFISGNEWCHTTDAP